jgi:hypothetical protein
VHLCTKEQNIHVPSKRYFYVDETGQDTRGELFIVSVAIVDQDDVAFLRSTCEEIERLSRKGSVKWRLAAPDRRLAYVRLVLQKSLVAGKLAFARYTDRRDYDAMMVSTIALAVKHAGEDGQATILVDGLSKERWRDYGHRLRRQGVRVSKVRGVRREENDAVIRLADAVCGFVRAAQTGHLEAKQMLDRAMKRGLVRDLGI